MLAFMKLSSAFWAVVLHEEKKGVKAFNLFALRFVLVRIYFGQK